MQADFTIFALELRRANDRLHVVESILDELATDPVLIDGQRCLLSINNSPHTETLSSYINTYGLEPPHMEFLTLQSIYYDTRTNEIILHFKDDRSSPNRHAYEFWHKCEFSRSSEWQDQPHLPPHHPTAPKSTTPVGFLVCFDQETICPRQSS